MMRKMSKKIISMLCAVVLTASAWVLPGYSAADSQDVTNGANLLKYLGIIDATFKDEYYSENITRADFAIYVSRMMSNTSVSEPEKVYYYDVPEDFWALSEINRLIEAGALTMPADRNFRPNDPIRKAEAVKIVLSLMKYSNYCEINGGYPNGYMEIAYKYDLLDNVGSGEYMTYRDSIMLMYNALEAPLMTIEFNGTTLYEDETILSYYFDTYSIEGQVTSASGIAISGEVAYEGEITIDEEKYQIEASDALEFLGQNVKAFIKEDSKQDIQTVIAVEAKENKNEVLEINVKDLKNVDLSSYKLEYYEGSKVKNADLSQGIMVLKNGENISGSLDTAFSFDKGIIKLVDSDNDGHFDYALNEVYRNIVVGYTDFEEEVIYDKYDSKNKLSLADYNQKLVNIYNGTKKIGIESITENMVLSVFDSANYVRVEVCTETLSGTVFDMKTEDDTEIKLGVTVSEAQWSVVSPEYVSIAGEALKPGASGTFYLDAYGEIAYAVLNTDTSYQFAYVKKAFINEDTGCAAVMLFMQDGTHKTLDCSARTRFDGDSEKNADIQNTMLQNRVGEIIRVKVSENSIIDIDTALSIEESANADSFAKTAHNDSSDANSARFSFSQKRFGYNIITSNAETIYFVVPEDVTNTDKSVYSIVDNSFFVGSQAYTVDSYKLSYDELYENVLVAKMGNTSPIGTQTMYLVGRKYIAAGEDEVENRVTGFIDGIEKEYIISPECDFTSVGAGDIIRVTSFDLEGRILTFTQMYDYSEDNWIAGNTANQQSSSAYLNANVININGNILTLDGGGNGGINTIKFDANTINTIIVYDESERGSMKAYKGNISALEPANYVTPGTKIIGRVKAGQMLWMVAYKK